MKTEICSPAPSLQPAALFTPRPKAAQRVREFFTAHNSNEHEGDLKHVDNFLECVRSRQQPTCHVESGYKVSVTCDLSVGSYRNGEVYYFETEREQAVKKG
jgi:hypothetical protein